MIIKEIKNLTHAEFEELRSIYVSTIPLENAKQLDTYINHIHDMLRNDNRYHLYAALEKRSIKISYNTKIDGLDKVPAF